MKRRTISHLAPWSEMRGTFVWDVPARFNIAVGCCDSWAEEDPDRAAIVDLSNGRRVWTYRDLKDASDRLAGVLARGGIDLILLDVMMPGEEIGRASCRERV